MSCNYEHVENLGTIKSKYFVLIGKLPPPIGGVRIHIDRLKRHLEATDINFQFIPLTFLDVLHNCKIIFRSCFIHLHTSNVWLRLLAAIICFFMQKKLILTYHGNLGRFDVFHNFADFLSVKFSYLPIVLNKDSLQLAHHFNTNAILLSAFIPPLRLPSSELLSKYFESFFKNSFKYTFCTNAWRLTYDKNGLETYGIIQLITLFNSIPNLGLIISDPSGAYYNHVQKNNIPLGENILLLSFPHTFIDVIKNTDCMIRATTTDGDSLSVIEALYYKKSVIASDCVERPQGCIIFHTSNIHDLHSAISNFSPNVHSKVDISYYNAIGTLIDLYHKELRSTDIY